MGHTLSPCSHESALRGLLALGASSGDSPELQDARASGDTDAQLIPSYGFDRRDNINSGPERSGTLRQSVLERTETLSHSTLSLQSTSHNESNQALRLHFGGSEDLDNIHDSSISILEEVPPGRPMPTDNSIELLQVYRYKIAPWLDICESNQPFGVTLLTRLNKSPSLRARVMQFAAAASKMVWIEESSDITDSTSNVNEAAVVSVLEAAGGMTPNLAASWLSEDGKESRKHLLGSLMSDSDSPGLTTSAYWLLVRLGKT